MLAALLLMAAAAGPAAPSKPAPAATAKPTTPPPPAPVCPPAPKVRCPDVDTALARALVFAAEPAPEEIRATAIEDLGLLGDDRVLSTLALMVLDPSAALQLASVRAVRCYPTARAEEILANAVRAPSISEMTKAYALESLAFYRTRSARQFLEHVRDSPAFPSKLQVAAQRTLQRAWP